MFLRALRFCALAGAVTTAETSLKDLPYGHSPEGTRKRSPNIVRNGPNRVGGRKGNGRLLRFI